MGAGRDPDRQRGHQLDAERGRGGQRLDPGVPGDVPGPRPPAHGNLEKPVTGAAADKARAAAVKAAGGGTAGAVTTDVSGNGL